MRSSHSRTMIDPRTGSNLRPLGVVGNRVIWPIMGASEPAVEPTSTPTPAPAPATEKTLTQSEVSAIAAKEKAEGKRAAEEAIAKDLGVTLAEAKAIIAAAREKADAEKSDAQKAREAADKEKAEAEQAKAEAAKDKHETALERALVRAGIDPDNDSRLARAIKSIEVEVGADADAIKKAVEALKKDEPNWFGVTTTGGRPPAPGSDPKGTPPKGGQGAEDAFSRGMKRATSGYATPAKI